MKKEKKPFVFQITQFVANWRDLPRYELLSYVLMFASVPMLAYGIQSYDYEIVRIIVLTIITLYSGFFAALIWNDITDFDIDVTAHPTRPLPSGKIKAKSFFCIAFIFSVITFCSAYFISVWCFVLAGLAALFVTFHNKYLKRKVKFPAYSEIFGPIQWLVVAIFGFFTVWTALPQHSDIFLIVPVFGTISTSTNAILQLVFLILFMYFADSAHDIAEGIHDYPADKSHGVKTYATTFGIERVVKIPLLYCIISGVFGILLFLFSVLSLVFFCFFIILFLYTFFSCFGLYRSQKVSIAENGAVMGRKLYDYVLFTFVLLFFDIILQVVYYNF